MLQLLSAVRERQRVPNTSTLRLVLLNKIGEAPGALETNVVGLKVERLERGVIACDERSERTRPFIPYVRPFEVQIL
jgi:hypothetical protein